MTRPMSDEDALIAGLRVRFEATGDPEHCFNAFCVGALSVLTVHASREGSFVQEHAHCRIRDHIAIGRASVPAPAAE